MANEIISTASNEDSKKDKLDLSIAEYDSILMEIRDQPAWRRNADIEDDYYDGKQLDSETLQMMKEMGMAPIVENIIAPTIDAVIGLEAKTRRDWRITAENDDSFTDTAEAMSQKLNEAEKNTRADRAISDAFGGQVKTGLGWVEVGREPDPFLYPYRVEEVHRNEIFWDFKDRTPDLRKARFLVRSKWYDKEPLKLAFDKKSDLIDHIASGWSGIDEMFVEGGETTGYEMDYQRDSALSIADDEWRDLYRERLRLNEVWYRRWIKGHVLKTPDGRVVEYDKKNKDHVQAVGMGLIVPQQAVFSKVRLSWWIGGHKLGDFANPYKHGKIPYIPFWGKRENMTGIPYGLIRSMKPMQDEVNARNTKIHWLLTAKRITMTEGVTVDDEETVRQEAGRPDAMHILDAEAVRQGGQFKVESDFGLNQQQYQALQDKRQGIKNVAGVYSAFEGSSQDMSGVAINSLAEQSSQTLADIYDNLNYGRSLVGEMLNELLIEDIGRQQYEVKIKKEFEEPRTVVLNMPVEKNGVMMLDNDLLRAKLKIALADIPTSASYRAQRLQTLTQITQSLPPNMQMLVLDFVMAATDEPNREEIVARIRKANGFTNNKEPKNEQEAQQMAAEQQAMAAQQQMQQKMAMLDIAEREAKVQKTIAEAQKIMAEAQGGDNGQVNALKEQYEAEVEQIKAQFEAAEKMFDTKMTEIEAKNRTLIEEAHIRANAMIEVAKINQQGKERLKLIEDQIQQLAGNRQPQANKE